ncbi:hypothetical protein DXG01_006188 [Tephrocybe rancida]|nr:hypothetical protein DXG01_006188 [Tephrocybe rancida]
MCIGHGTRTKSFKNPLARHLRKSPTIDGPGKIARRIGCSSQTVANVLNKTTNGENDKGSDWDEVGLEFMREYNLTRPVKGDDLEERQVHIPVAETSSAPLSAIERDVTGARASQSRVIMGQKKNVKDLQPSGPVITEVKAQPEKEVASLFPDLGCFLSNLEHDMSEFADALAAQGLGTSEKIFVFASWPEEKLHELFEETLPRLTIPQRFMLVNGLKNIQLSHKTFASRSKRHARLRLTRQERSEARILSRYKHPASEIAGMYRCSELTIANILSGNVGYEDAGEDWDVVDADFCERYPRLETIQIDINENSSETHAIQLPDLKEFLASLEHDLSELTDTLEAQDIGTPEKFFAFSTWDKQDLLDLFAEALPQTTAPQRHMLARGLRLIAGV